MPQTRVDAYSKGYAIGEWGDFIVLYAVYVAGETYKVSIGDHMHKLEQTRAIIAGLPDWKQTKGQNTYGRASEI